MSKNTKQNCAPCKKTSIGGQALMEGIMMRGPQKTAMAVRNAKGEIILEASENKKPSVFAKIPFVRGIVNMVSSLVTGYKYLMRSADIALADAEEADKAAKAEKEAKKAAETGETIPKPVASDASAAVEEAPATAATETVVEEKPAEEPTEKKKEKKKTSFATILVMVIGVILGVGLALALFIALPSYLFKGVDLLAGGRLTATESYGMNLFRSAFEGVFKIIILVVYMFLVSLMKDIRRTFMYHGAEHKTIFCYEAGLELTVENVRIQRRFHPRCGTSFLILVLLVSIFLGFFIPATIDTWLRILIKFALLPLTIGIGYELIKLAGRKDNIITRIISAPGVWLQHITTVEPDDSMIECAIAAMNEVIPEDKSTDNW